MAEHVYLASKSPRRLELLTSLGLKVTVAAGNLSLTASGTN